MTEVSKNAVKYIVSFDKNQQASVIAAIEKETVLKQALETPEGKAIFKGVIGNIHQNTMKIIKLCGDDPVKNDVTIKQAGFEINYGYSLLYDWAKILKIGEEYDK